MLLSTICLAIALSACAQVIDKNKKTRFLALGDSYTIGQSVAPQERWPVQLVSRLRASGADTFDPEIIARTGWRTDDLSSAIASTPLSPPYDLVSLLIGVNNYFQGRTPESYRPEFEGLLATAIRLAGGRSDKVFVVSIPDYGYTPFGRNNQPVISAGIDAYNRINEAIAAQYGVAYYNITDISRRGLQDPTLVASDGLHPSGKMYTEWVDRIIRRFTFLPVKDSENPVTSIEQPGQPFHMYPNPVGEFLTIETETGGELYLYNTLGSQVISTTINGGKSLISLNTLNPGQYRVKFVRRSDVFSYRLLKN